MQLYISLKEVDNTSVVPMSFEVDPAELLEGFIYRAVAHTVLKPEHRKEEHEKTPLAYAMALHLDGKPFTSPGAVPTVRLKL